MIALRQTMQAGHLNFLNPYLRQIWMTLAIASTLAGLHTQIAQDMAVSLNGALGGHYMKGYLIAGILGAALFCGYWALINKVILASASAKQDTGAQKQDAKPPAESKPEEKKTTNAEADKKKKPEKQKNVVQQGQGNVNIDQHTEGNNSPITNSPITVNPPVNPNAPVVTYDFNGAKRVTRPGKNIVEAGEQFSKFQEMAMLEKEHKWDALRDAAEAQIKAVPNWLTPYLFAAQAYANLGNKSKAIELCEYVKTQSDGNADFDKPADDLLKSLKQ